jgi:protein FrlC
MNLGTATSVLFQYALADAVPLVARAGYDGIDIWGGRPHAYRDDLSPDELKNLRSLIDDHGLTVVSFMPAFYRYPHSLSNPNPRILADSIDYMCRCLDNAALLGAGIVLVVPDHSLFGQSREDSLHRMIHSIDRVAEYATQYDGIRLGIEILYFDETDLVTSADDALFIMEQVPYDNLGAVLDTGTLNLSKEAPADIFAKLGNRVLQIHANDNAGHDRQQNLIPGEGTYDFAALSRFLKEQDYQGFVSAELSKEYSDNPEPALVTTAQRLRAWAESA